MNSITGVPTMDSYYNYIAFKSNTNISNNSCNCFILCIVWFFRE